MFARYTSGSRPRSSTSKYRYESTRWRTFTWPTTATDEQLWWRNCGLICKERCKTAPSLPLISAPCQGLMVDFARRSAKKKTSEQAAQNSLAVWRQSTVSSQGEGALPRLPTPSGPSTHGKCRPLSRMSMPRAAITLPPLPLNQTLPTTMTVLRVSTLPRLPIGCCARWRARLPLSLRRQVQLLQERRGRAPGARPRLRQRSHSGRRWCFQHPTRERGGQSRDRQV